MVTESVSMNTDFSVRLSNTVQEFLAGKLAGKYKRSLQLIGHIDSFDSRWGYLKTCHIVSPRPENSQNPNKFIQFLAVWSSSVRCSPENIDGKNNGREEVVGKRLEKRFSAIELNHLPLGRMPMEMDYTY